MGRPFVHVEADPIDAGHIEGQGREKGADLVADDQPSGPVVVTVEADDIAVQQPIARVLLEELAIGRLANGEIGARFPPRKHIVPVDQVMTEGAVVIAPVKGWQQGLIWDLVVRLRAVDIGAAGPVDEGVGREKGRHPGPELGLLGFEPRKWEGRQEE